MWNQRHHIIVWLWLAAEEASKIKVKWEVTTNIVCCSLLLIMWLQQIYVHTGDDLHPCILTFRINKRCLFIMYSLYDHYVLWDDSIWSRPIWLVCSGCDSKLGATGFESRPGQIFGIRVMHIQCSKPLRGLKCAVLSMVLCSINSLEVFWKE